MADQERGLFFLDSGAFSLYMKEVAPKAKGGVKRDFSFYESDQFWDYVDAYAEFVKKHRDVIDYYANVDVMYSASRSWDVLKYLEDEHGLDPVPVYHMGSDASWLDRFLEDGYEFIAFGGLAATGSSPEARDWLDRSFTRVCDGPDRMPSVRVHGFAVTAYPLLIRYPWWSVDSATWTKVGAFGSILVPHRREGKFTFAEAPYVISVSKGAPCAKEEGGRHFDTLTRVEKKTVLDWLEQIGIPFGEGEGEEIKVAGVCNRHTERKVANLLFFEALRKWLPAWPWAFRAPLARRRIT